MRFPIRFRHGLLAASAVLLLPLAAHADEIEPRSSGFDIWGPTSEVLHQAQASMVNVVDQAMTMLGVPYRFGGASPESGIDCSGFVGNVFREGLGLILPRTSAEMSKAGESIDRKELKPGDLVFFNTMRRAFSHVGIYLGNGQFIHAPRAGGRVRVDDLSESYWHKRFNGARRVDAK
jgi:cell wall-associated NlpC family hydrolase